MIVYSCDNVSNYRNYIECPQLFYSLLNKNKLSDNNFPLQTAELLLHMIAFLITEYRQ